MKQTAVSIHIDDIIYIIDDIIWTSGIWNETWALRREHTVHDFKLRLVQQCVIQEKQGDELMD